MTNLSQAEINFIFLFVGFVLGIFTMGTTGWFKHSNCTCKEDTKDAKSN